MKISQLTLEERKKIQDGIDIDLMFSHINSAHIKSLTGKAPYETSEFLYLSEILF